MPALPRWLLDSHLQGSGNSILLQWYAAVACVRTKGKASDLAQRSDRYPFRKIASSLQAGLGVEIPTFSRRSMLASCLCGCSV